MKFTRRSSLSINQDANIYATNLTTGQKADFIVELGRHAWLQVARGTLIVNGTMLKSGDAVATSRPTELHIVATEVTDALLFDLA